MRALVLHAFGELAVENLPDPTPREGETLIRILATGICGTDVHGFTGENQRRHPGQVMGHETVGLVEEVGLGTPSGPDVGTLVTVNPLIACGNCAACQAGRQQACRARRIIGVDPAIQSAFAELMVVPSRNVVPLPPNIPAEYGALVEPLAVGYHAVGRGGCHTGERVLVAGGGPIGQACFLAARRAGASVVVSEPDPRRRRLLDRLGAPTVDPSGEAVARGVERLFGGPAMLAIDAVGSSASIADCLAASSLSARVVLVGMHEPRLEIAAYDISTAERTVIGSFCYSAREFEATAAWVGTAPPELASLIENIVDVTEAATAFGDAVRGENGPGKVLVALNGDLCRVDS